MCIRDSYRVDRNGWALLTLFIGDLADKLGQDVYGKTWAARELPVSFDIKSPLLTD